MGWTLILPRLCNMEGFLLLIYTMEEVNPPQICQFELKSESNKTFVPTIKIIYDVGLCGVGLQCVLTLHTAFGS